ncbi:DUF3306 domain-containing protein [Methylobacterium sp. Gmos1]
MSDGFLARWSRRKRDEARRPADVAPEAVPAEPASVPPEDEAGLTPEELAQLPSLDALTAATDLTPFLRAGVPRALRNAALRRMWSVDPAIRDFVSEAREYAYDWNTPGGVPGTGGLISAEEVRAMVERVFGGGEEKSSAVADEGDVSGDVAPSPSPRGREEACTPLVGGEGSPRSEPQVRREGEGVSTDEVPPEPPPHRRVEPYGIDAPPRSVDDEVAGALSPPAGRGDAHLPLASLPPLDGSPRLAPAGREPEAERESSPPSPPRLRRHGGAVPI